MNIFNVPFEQIGPSHISGLIGTQENDVLDFKQEAYKETDPAKFELCKDVSSFSNAQGGFIIIGVIEENDTAKEIVHVPDADLEIERMENVLLSSVYERIPILKIKKITVPVNGEGRDTIVILVPKSLRAPHMVKRQNKTAFYKRYGRRVLEMPIDEIKDASIKSSHEIAQVELFLNKRKEVALQRAGDNSMLILFATPQYLVEQNIDVQNAHIQECFNQNNAYLTQYKDRDRGGWIARGDRIHTKPSLYGLVCDDYRRTELFRTGHIETYSPCDDFFTRKRRDHSQQEKTVLYDLPLSEFVLSFIYLAQSIYQASGLYHPFLFNLLLVNCEDYHLPLNMMSFSKFGEKILELPQQTIDISEAPEKMAKIIMDRFFQAFGVWESFRFKDDRLDFSARYIDQ